MAAMPGIDDHGPEPHPAFLGRAAYRKQAQKEHQKPESGP